MLKSFNAHVCLFSDDGLVAQWEKGARCVGEERGGGGRVRRYVYGSILFQPSCRLASKPYESEL